MPGRDGTGPMGIGAAGLRRGGCAGPRSGGGFRGRGCGFAPGGGLIARAANRQFEPDAALLEERAGWLEKQAAACRALAAKTKDTKPEND